jgi:hypothetical protein
LKIPTGLLRQALAHIEERLGAAGTANVRASFASYGYGEGGSVMLEATPEQKQRIEPVLRERKHEETASCLAATFGRT